MFYIPHRYRIGRRSGCPEILGIPIGGGGMSTSAINVDNEIGGNGRSTGGVAIGGSGMTAIDIASVSGRIDLFGMECWS
jgi:hypothetical protein